MIKCPNCGYVNENSSNCMICGNSLSNDNNKQENESYQENNYSKNNQYEQFNNPEYQINANPDFTQKETTETGYNRYNERRNEFNMQGNGYSNQSNYQTNNNSNLTTQSQYMKPQHLQKSKMFGIVIGILFPGAGYCYLDQWKKGVGLYIVEWILLLFSGLVIPFIAFVIIWIYAIYDVYQKTDLYNMGILIN